jgi:LEA14-like dessication related protein
MNIKDIVVNKTGQNMATVKIIFAAHNPQANTVLLDGIDYNIYVNNQTVSSGNIGSEALIDVMRSEPEFPIIGNDTVVLKDAHTIHTNEAKDDISNVITSGNVCFNVNGTYFYIQEADLAASGGANEFHITFPNNCK